MTTACRSVCVCIKGGLFGGNKAIQPLRRRQQSRSQTEDAAFVCWFDSCRFQPHTAKVWDRASTTQRHKTQRSHIKIHVFASSSCSFFFAGLEASQTNSLRSFNPTKCLISVHKRPQRPQEVQQVTSVHVVFWKQHQINELFKLQTNKTSDLTEANQWVSSNKWWD